MTKAEILKLAKDVTLMDELNTISGLLEIDTPDNKELRDSLINDIYQKLQSNKQKKITKPKMLYYIMNRDYKLYRKIKDQTWITVNKVYVELKNSEVIND